MAPPWYLLLLVALVGAWDCPDGTTCGEKTVCCLLPDSDVYGCCPQNEIVSSPLPMVTLDLPCTEHAGCPEEYTCVSTPQGGSACCPLDQGISCKDGHHCCPSGSQCSEDGHSCIPVANQSAIICPDGTSECPNDATCCQMADQSWGCCPLEQATCCSDHIHCCPHNTQCDLEHASCASSNGRLPLSKKFPARMRLIASENIQRTKCRDGSTCPDGSTCCQLGDRSFGCCPMISAVCCGDHVHCCPAGTTCDIPEKKCVSKDFETPMYLKTPALREEATVKCDDTSECPGTETCCRLPSGEWGCCPFENAVCCPDKEHCCPFGSTCTSSGSCQSNSHTIPWLQKTPALKYQSTVKCDDTEECPGTQTCCRLPSGEWGCCPFENAVCCPDKAHCCPSGSTCTSTESCQSNSHTIPWLQKTPALKSQSTNVQCDTTTYCPDKTTCCRLESGDWGCCPIEQAVCCSDHQHCCPSGYTCDVAAGTCNKPAEALAPVNSAEVAAPVKPMGAVERVEPVDYVWCDATHACYDGQTCCSGYRGIWTCCPYTHGVCCPDRIHCCPYGHVCLNQGLQCSRSAGALRWDVAWMKKAWKKEPVL